MRVFKTHRPRRSRRTLCALVLSGAFLVNGCAIEPPPAERYPTLRTPSAGEAANQPSTGPLLGEASAAFAEAAKPASGPSQPRVYPGAAPANMADERTAASGETIILNFEQTEIKHAAKALIGDFLGANFTVDSEVKGVIDLRSTSALNADAALAAFEAVLRQNSAALVIEDGIYRILPLSKARGLASIRSAAQSAPLKAGYSVRVVPLRFIAASEMAEILKPFLSEDGAVRVDGERNLLIMAGTSGELRLWLETIENFDIDWFAGKSVGLFPLANATAGDVIRELEAIYGSADKSGDALRLVAVDRVNAVMAVASDAGLVRNVGTWVKRLDENGRSTRAFRVYHMKNARAGDIAPLLQEVFGLERTAPAASRSIVPPGETPAESEAPAASLVAMTQASTGPGFEIGGAQQLKIIPDDQLNALVILATDEEFASVSNALRKLDVAPLQVLVEATVAEVTITNDLRYGVQYLLDGSLFQENATAILTQAQTATIGSTVPGFSAVIGSPAKIILDALESVTEVNVISSPNLMVLDNGTATLSVGNQVPVAVQSQTSAVNNDQVLVNTIEFRDTGVIFEVTPRISSDGMVSLDITQEVSTVSPSSGDTLTPTISQRRIKSTVIVGSGETIVLGGLFSDTASNGRSGLPILSRAPIVGGLFGTTEKSKGRTELIVLIQPRIMRNQADARALTDELRRRVTGLTLVPETGALGRPPAPVSEPMPRIEPRLERETRAPAIEAPGELAAPRGVSAATGSTMVQLGAVQTEEAARAVWAGALADNPDALTGRQMNLVRARSAGGKEIIRVQIGPMSLASAEELCRGLSGPCLVVR